jgi:hypothetical protein
VTGSSDKNRRDPAAISRAGCRRFPSARVVLEYFKSKKAPQFISAFYVLANWGAFFYFLKLFRRRLV